MSSFGRVWCRRLAFLLFVYLFSVELETAFGLRQAKGPVGVRALNG